MWLTCTFLEARLSWTLFLRIANLYSSFSKLKISPKSSLKCKVLLPGAAVASRAFNIGNIGTCSGSASVFWSSICFKNMMGKQLDKSYIKYSCSLISWCVAIHRPWGLLSETLINPRRPNFLTLNPSCLRAVRISPSLPFYSTINHLGYYFTWYLFWLGLM